KFRVLLYELVRDGFWILDLAALAAVVAAPLRVQDRSRDLEPRRPRLVGAAVWARHVDAAAGAADPLIDLFPNQPRLTVDLWHFLVRSGQALAIQLIGSVSRFLVRIKMLVLTEDSEVLPVAHAQPP